MGMAPRMTTDVTHNPYKWVWLTKEAVRRLDSVPYNGASPVCIPILELFLSVVYPAGMTKNRTCNFGKLLIICCASINLYTN